MTLTHQLVEVTSNANAQPERAWQCMTTLAILRGVGLEE